VISLSENDEACWNWFDRSKLGLADAGIEPIAFWQQGRQVAMCVARMLLIAELTIKLEKRRKRI
jgi:hypothetical protein